MAINGLGHRGWKALQNGIKERLFCESCEQHFNKYYEKPFLAQWVVAAPLPNPWNVSDVHWITVDYISFKLFHLSNFFRAGVSSHPSYREVSLGPHQETLRQLILNRDPGRPNQYPIFGHAVVHDKTNRLISMVSSPVIARFGGQVCYGMIYGGVRWWVCVSSHPNIEFEQGALQPDGRMPFCAIPWNEIPEIQSASRALRTPTNPALPTTHNKNK